MSSEAHDEREFKTEVELKTPEWMPGGKRSVHFRRVWDKRASKVVDQVAEIADVDEKVLLKRIDVAGSFADVFYNAGSRMIQDGDPVLWDVCARLIAAALHDDARIHEASYLLAKLERFHPIHIRIIAALSVDSVYKPYKRTVEEISVDVNANKVLVESAIGELEQDRFIVKCTTINTERHRPGDPVMVWQSNEYALGELGVVLTKLIDEFRK